MGPTWASPDWNPIQANQNIVILLSPRKDSANRKYKRERVRLVDSSRNLTTLPATLTKIDQVLLRLKFLHFIYLTLSRPLCIADIYHAQDDISYEEVSATLK